MLAVVQNRDGRALDGHPDPACGGADPYALSTLLRGHRRRADRAALQRAFRHGHAVRPEGLCCRHSRRHRQRLGRDDCRPAVRRGRGAGHHALGSGYTQIITFALVIAALAWRPNGLFGRAEVKKV
jgi:hypothetical protein